MKNSDNKRCLKAIFVLNHAVRHRKRISRTARVKTIKAAERVISLHSVRLADSFFESRDLHNTGLIRQITLALIRASHCITLSQGSRAMVETEIGKVESLLMR